MKIWIKHWNRFFTQSTPLPSARYKAGIASYGKPVNSERRKARIIAKLNAMGVKPRIRRKMGRKIISYDLYLWMLRHPKRSARFTFAGQGRLPWSH